MFNRRETIAATIVAAAFAASPASACRAPAPKNRTGYTRAIDNLFAAWWARDYEAFLKPFEHPDREDAVPDRTFFSARYLEPAPRFRGQLLFNGASAVVQVITPQNHDRVHGICGGYAQSEIFLVKFYPGLEVPVVQTITLIDDDLLADGEWEHLPGAPKLAKEPYWQTITKRERE